MLAQSPIIPDINPPTIEDYPSAQELLQGGLKVPQTVPAPSELDTSGIPSDAGVPPLSLPPSRPLPPINPVVPNFGEMLYDSEPESRWEPANIPAPTMPTDPKNFVQPFLNGSQTPSQLLESAFKPQMNPGAAFNPFQWKFGDMGEGPLGALFYALNLPFAAAVGLGSDLSRFNASQLSGLQQASGNILNRIRESGGNLLQLGGSVIKDFGDGFSSTYRATADPSEMSFFTQALGGRAFSFSDDEYNKRGQLNPLGYVTSRLVGIGLEQGAMLPEATSLKDTTSSKQVRTTYAPFFDIPAGFFIGAPVEGAINLSNKLTGTEPLKLPKLSDWLADRVKQAELTPQIYMKRVIGFGLDAITGNLIETLPRSISSAVLLSKKGIPTTPVTVLPPQRLQLPGRPNPAGNLPGAPPGQPGLPGTRTIITPPGSSRVPQTPTPPGRVIITPAPGDIDVTPIRPSQNLVAAPPVIELNGVPSNVVELRTALETPEAAVRVSPETVRPPSFTARTTSLSVLGNNNITMNYIPGRQRAVMNWQNFSDFTDFSLGISEMLYPRRENFLSDLDFQDALNANEFIIPNVPEQFHQFFEDAQFTRMNNYVDDNVIPTNNFRRYFDDTSNLESFRERVIGDIDRVYDQQLERQGQLSPGMGELADLFGQADEIGARYIEDLRVADEQALNLTRNAADDILDNFPEELGLSNVDPYGNPLGFDDGLFDDLDNPERGYLTEEQSAQISQSQQSAIEAARVRDYNYDPLYGDALGLQQQLNDYNIQDFSTETLDDLAGYLSSYNNIPDERLRQVLDERLASTVSNPLDRNNVVNRVFQRLENDVDLNNIYDIPPIRTRSQISLGTTRTFGRNGDYSLQEYGSVHFNYELRPNDTSFRIRLNQNSDTGSNGFDVNIVGSPTPRQLYSIFKEALQLDEFKDKSFKLAESNYRTGSSRQNNRITSILERLGFDVSWEYGYSRLDNYTTTNLASEILSPRNRRDRFYNWRRNTRLTQIARFIDRPVQEFSNLRMQQIYEITQQIDRSDLQDRPERFVGEPEPLIVPLETLSGEDLYGAVQVGEARVRIALGNENYINLPQSREIQRLMDTYETSFLLRAAQMLEELTGVPIRGEIFQPTSRLSPIAQRIAYAVEDATTITASGDIRQYLKQRFPELVEGIDDGSLEAITDELAAAKLDGVTEGLVERIEDLLTDSAGLTNPEVRRILTEISQPDVLTYDMAYREVQLSLPADMRGSSPEVRAGVQELINADTELENALRATNDVSQYLADIERPLEFTQNGVTTRVIDPALPLYLGSREVDSPLKLGDKLTNSQETATSMARRLVENPQDIPYGAPRVTRFGFRFAGDIFVMPPEEFTTLQQQLNDIRELVPTDMVDDTVNQIYQSLSTDYDILPDGTVLNPAPFLLQERLNVPEITSAAEMRAEGFNADPSQQSALDLQAQLVDDMQQRGESAITALDEALNRQGLAEDNVRELVEQERERRFAAPEDNPTRSTERSYFDEVLEYETSNDVRITRHRSIEAPSQIYQNLWRGLNEEVFDALRENDIDRFIGTVTRFRDEHLQMYDQLNDLYEDYTALFIELNNRQGNWIPSDIFPLLDEICD